MRMTRFGAIAASAALASATVLGAGTAVAQDNGDPVTITAPGNYEMTATDLGDCRVEFTLNSLRDDNYGNWRGDFQVNGEEPITEAGGSRGEVYRPVITNRPGVAAAIAGRENPYDFDSGEATVTLTEPRTVPYAEGNPNRVYDLPGVQPNETGEHTINFGVYQGPVQAGTTEVYNLDGEITVTGCPIANPLDRLSSELDVFGSLNLSS